MSRRSAVQAVAEPLLAFLREPALVRPAWLHGEMPMPDGETVLRLALGRIPASELSPFTARERADLHEAAIAFVRQVCLWDKATHYQVLALPAGARPEAVKANYHLLIALLHPDRRESPSGAWPADGAPRANQAYAVLGDPARRKLYDEELRHAAGSPPHPLRGASPLDPHRRRSRRFNPRALLRSAAVVTGVIAALFVVQAWWVEDPSPEHSLLQRAASGRWVRDVLPDPPRFLAAAGLPIESVEPLPPLPPPRRMAALSNWVPVMEAAAQPAERSVIAPAVPAPRTADAAPLRLAQATGTPAARPSPAAAQTPPAAAAPAPVPPHDAPSRDDVENLVALLVSSYDAGDAAKLVALFDRDRLGFWAGSRTQNAYSEFFNATRERRMRVERLAWQPNGTMAVARGEALVTAEYADGRPRLERRVPLEVDVAMRDGQPRIARLVLFPVPQ